MEDYADEPALQNGGLPSDLWDDESPDENHLHNQDDAEATADVSTNNAEVARLTFMLRESSEVPFTAPQMSSPERCPQDDNADQDTSTNLQYKDVLNSIQSEEPADEVVQEAVDETAQESEEPESPPEESDRSPKSKFGFNFLERRQKSPDERSKVPAFIRRQAN